MQYGINLLLWTDGYRAEHAELLHQAKLWGFDGVEVPVFDPAAVEMKNLKAVLAESRLEVTTCTSLPRDASLIAESADERGRAVAYLEVVLQATHDMGSRLLCGPVFAPVGKLPGRRRTDDEWQWGVEGLRRVAARAEELDVTIAVEPLNRFETYFLNTAADAVRFVQDIGHPRVKILCDTFHCNIEEPDVARAYRTCGEHLGHVHISESDRGTPGSGHVPWAAVVAELHALRYDGWLVIESFGSRIPEIAAATCIWRDLAPSPEALARDGLRFIKSLTQ